MRKLITALYLSSFSFSSYAAIEINDNFTLSGFGSTSVAKSTNETQLLIHRAISDDLCFDCDTTFGLQLDYFNDAFKVSAQLVKRPQDDWDEPELEWAYVGYTIENVELRAGRLRLPLFLASEYFFVGHAYTYARPPDELYNSLLGITAYNGFSAVWNLELFDKYQLSINPFVELSSSKSIDISKQLSIDIDVDNTLGINFLFSGSFYRWNFTYLDSSFDQTTKFINSVPGVPYFEIDIPDNNIEVFSLGTEYEFDNLKLSGEVLFTDFGSSWYTSAAYRVNKYAPYVVFGEKHDKPTVTNSYNGKTGSSVTLGVHYDIKYNLSMNVEWQQFKSFAAQNGSFVETPQKPDANLYSVMFNFVF